MSKDNTAASNVIPFHFGAKQVRTVDIEGTAWFVAADVCAVLSIKNHRESVRHLDEDEKGVISNDTLGGRQDMTVVSESGLYALVLRSRKPEARAFTKWVTAEVLPAIRKHGHYNDSLGRMGTLIGQTIGTDGFHMLGSIVKGKVTGLPVAVRRRAISKIWAQTHAAFGVRSAEDIPAEQLDSVRNFIAAYAIEGEFLGKERSGLPDFSIPPDASLVQRWLLSRGPDGKPRIKEIPIDACVMSIPDFLTKINETNGLCLTRTELFDFAIASITQLRRRVID